MIKFPSKRDCQVLWVFAALERLQNLGMIGGANYSLTPDGIDLFIEIDEHRDVLFDSERDFDLAVTVVCRDKNPDHSEEDIAQIIQVVRDFRDRREDLVKFALNEIVNK